MGYFEAILWLSWPSRRHLSSILRHFSVTTSEDGRCIADLQNSHLAYTRARFFAFFGATCGLLSPSWRHLETVLRHSQAILGRLGTISARLGPSWRHFGPSRRADRRRQSSFRKIRTSPTREHRFVVALRPSFHYLGVILGPSCGHIGHLGVILGLSCAIPVL